MILFIGVPKKGRKCTLILPYHDGITIGVASEFAAEFCLIESIHLSPTSDLSSATLS